MRISWLCALPLLAVGLTAVSPAPCLAHPRAAEESSSASRRPIFEFHSGFWINLHHFLYEEAALRDDGPRPVRHEPISADDTAVESTLTPDEQKTWNSAIAYYKANLICKDLLANDAMRNIKNQLEQSADEDSLRRTMRMEPALIAALNRAAPIYRAHWWTRHDRANHAWIDAVNPLLAEHGRALTVDLSKAFGAPWPEQALRVDVVSYANWAGAYTSLRPSRITVSSLDARNQQTAALEILFHEASHTLVENVGDTLIRDFAAHRKTAPRDLWHALLFFTAGYYVHQICPDYVPYADHNDLWKHGFSSQFEDVLIADWQPRLEGKVTLEAALARLAADLPEHGRS